MKHSAEKKDVIITKKFEDDFCLEATILPQNAFDLIFAKKETPNDHNN